MEDSWCSVRNCEGGEQRKKRNAAYPYDDFKVDYKNFLSQVFFLSFWDVHIYIYITQKDNPQEIQIYNQDMVSRSFSAAKKQQKHLAARAKG